MTRARIIAAAFVVDWIVGDPEWMPHPVRLMGRSIALGERYLRRPREGSDAALVKGALLTCGVVVISFAGTARLVKSATRWNKGASRVVAVLLASTCLASRNLFDEAGTVIAALDDLDLPRARMRLARIVGRDTATLHESEIARALIETLAESSCDGIVAPLFYLAVGGVPLAMAYKAVNTLDSMIGHADQEYFWFGKVAARLDDVANYFPARLTALFIAVTAGLGGDTNGAQALRTWVRDGAKHKSPNAGQPESAMAGALRVRLGGENTYAGECVASPLLGAEFEQPMLLHAKRALRVVTVVSMMGAAVAVMICWCVSPRRFAACSQ